MAAERESLAGADYDALLAAIEAGTGADELRARFPRFESTIAALLAARGTATLGPATPNAEATGPVALDSPTGEYDFATLVARLREHTAPDTRYQLKSEVGRGGMGVVHRAFDRTMRRAVAFKSLRPRDRSAEPAGAAAESRTLAKFFEEAQITGQLDHPGIVPIHDLGVDSAGRLYITMKLVRGDDLARVFSKIAAGTEGWNVSRGLAVLQRVCEAMAFAHQRGVIHRDLKPGNVMVGEFGEVYVMDWGLARVLSAPDRHDIRLRARAGDESASSFAVRSDRADAAIGSSALLTMDGEIVGTPAYMAPEQARGELEAVGPRSDVYAVGAMLYHLLAGHEPFGGERPPLPAALVLHRVLAGPPTPLADVARAAPPELVAICERAMARDASARYASMRDLGDDLRAFLENRVVHAYETGALAELRKWIARNRTFAATIGAAAIATVALAGWAIVERGRALEAVGLARAREAEANAEREKVLRVSAVKVLADLEREWAELWPIDEAHAPAMAAWIVRAEALCAVRDEHRGVLAELRRRGAAGADGSVDFGADVQSRWWFDTLSGLVAGLDRLADPSAAERTIASMKERHAIASSLRRRTIVDHAAEWQATLAALAASPRYSNLTLAPQVGLVPLGPDPTSGFFEFASIVTGDPPQRDPTSGALILAEDSAAVLVLLPGGEFTIGAQATDPAAPNYEESVGTGEEPVGVVKLAPFFCGKHEITQRQYRRIMNSNPSTFPAGDTYRGRAVRGDQPVETVTWHDCAAFVARIGHGAALPTEAQWEYAARAGTSTRWWCGDEVAGLDEVANLCDLTAKQDYGNESWQYDESLEDGFAGTAPVGSLRPNAFGIHDVHGNVAEWCSGVPIPYTIAAREGDGQRVVDFEFRQRAVRGGSYSSVPFGARSALRVSQVADQAMSAIGFRIVMAIAD